MKRCQYVALFIRQNRKYVLLKNIINLNTGLDFRDHCWIKKGKLFFGIPTGSIVIFKAKETQYKKLYDEKIGQLAVIRVAWRKHLVRLSDVEIASAENGF